MIQVQPDCFWIQTEKGDLIPCSPDSIAIEILGNETPLLDPEVVKQAVHAILYYYQNDLGRNSITIAEFTQSLEEALKSVEGISKKPILETEDKIILQMDIAGLAERANSGFELLFFNELRQVMTEKLASKPHIVQCVRLREGIKMILHQNHWNHKCQQLSDQVVAYLRSLLKTHPDRPSCALIIR
jgi:hypothetical protein